MLGCVWLVGAGVTSAAPAAGTALPYSALAKPLLERPALPIWPNDAPDPDVVRFKNVYYAFTTGTTWGNYIGLLESSSVLSGWHSANGLPYGSSALPVPPGWEAVNTQNAPTVARIDGHYVMFYDAALASDPKEYCLSRAAASSPAGPYTDDSTSFFGHCAASYNGSIDPDLVESPEGIFYLVWKENDSGPYGSAQLISQALNDTATALVGTPHVLLTQDSAAFAWETTTEGPSLTYTAGAWWLLFSAGLWTNSTYSEAFVRCTGPLGPCGDTPAQILTSYGEVHGPGGGTALEGANGEWYLAFAAWTGSCTGVGGDCGRELYMAPIEFNPLRVTTVSLPPIKKDQKVELQIAASGGIGPETWRAGDLPSGLVLDSLTGMITGSTTAVGLHQITVTVVTSGSYGGQSTTSIPLTVKS